MTAGGGRAGAGGRVPLEWRSGPDQIGHAYERSRRPASRALCGVRLVDVRLAWPPVVKCPDCLMVDDRAARTPAA